MGTLHFGVSTDDVGRLHAGVNEPVVSVMKTWDNFVEDSVNSIRSFHIFHSDTVCLSE